MNQNIESIFKAFNENTNNSGHATRSPIGLNEYNYFIKNNTLVNHFSRLGIKLKGDILEVGSSIGTTSYSISSMNEVKSLTCVEPETEAFQIAVATKEMYDPDNKIHFFNNTLENLSLNKKFDFVICNTVLEHTSNPREILLILLETLKPGGQIYLSTPNYTIPFEPHIRLFYFLPFLNKPTIKLIARIFGRNYKFVDHLSFVRYHSVVKWIDTNSFDVENIFLKKINLNLFYGSLAKKLLKSSFIKKVIVTSIMKTNLFPSIELLITKKKA